MPSRTGGAHQDQTGRGRAGSDATSHTVAGEDSSAALAQTGPILLEALLNCHVVAQLLTTKPLCIPFARRLLLRRSHVALAQRGSYSHQNDDGGKDEMSHRGNSELCGANFVLVASSLSAALYSGMQALLVAAGSRWASARHCALLATEQQLRQGEAVLDAGASKVVKRRAAYWR
jgi:hypothetical protein